MKFFQRILNREQKGELSFYIGDYVKFDEAGCPYPNTKEFFEKNHHQIGKNLYEQYSIPLWAWKFVDSEEWSGRGALPCGKKGLLINESDYMGVYESTFL